MRRAHPHNNKSKHITHGTPTQLQAQGDARTQEAAPRTAGAQEEALRKNPSEFCRLRYGTQWAEYEPWAATAGGGGGVPQTPGGRCSRETGGVGVKDKTKPMTLGSRAGAPCGWATPPGGVWPPTRQFHLGG